MKGVVGPTYHCYIEVGIAHRGRNSEDKEESDILGHCDQSLGLIVVEYSAHLTTSPDDIEGECSTDGYLRILLN
jgi:hypothetical protein